MIEVTEKKDYRLVTNEMRLEFAAVSDNEAFARMAVAAFIAPLNPTLEELSDVKTAVSEAVTNAIIHGYILPGMVAQAHNSGPGKTRDDQEGFKLTLGYTKTSRQAWAM